MTNRRYLIAAIALVIAAMATTIVYADLAVGTKAPSFTLPTIDGKTLALSSYQKTGKVVVLDIWATWCPPCRSEIPQLVNIQKKLKGKNAAIVGVAIDQEMSAVVGFAKAQNINYVVAHDPNGNKIGQLYQVRSVPATYIIDKKGVIRYVHSGFPRDPGDAKAEAAKIEREVCTLLAKK